MELVLSGDRFHYFQNLPLKGPFGWAGRGVVLESGSLPFIRWYVYIYIYIYTYTYRDIGIPLAPGKPLWGWEALSRQVAQALAEEEAPQPVAIHLRRVGVLQPRQEEGQKEAGGLGLGFGGWCGWLVWFGRGGWWD